MINLLKEVGRGKRGARDLTYEESLEAAEAIIHLRATPAQIGAFFMAERIKMESVEELEAFVAVCRKAAYREPIQEGIDFAGPYDGRTKSFFATFATAFVLTAAGLPVTLHMAASLPPKWGVTLHDLLLAAGIQVDHVSREQLIHTARETGLLCVPAEQWCPPLTALRPIREQLGMRTLLNTAEKLIDYSFSPYLVFGIYHNTVFERMSRLLFKLSYRRAMIVQGVEGSEDLFIDRPTRIYYLENGFSDVHIVNPHDFGLAASPPEREWSPAAQIRVTESVLQGDGDLAFHRQVILNSAYRLHFANRATSIDEGIEKAKGLLNSGKAWKVYAKWKSCLS